MNVAFDPWIPVVTLEGKPKLASLCEVLTQGHLLADLSVRPHERVSLMRLFLCVAHAALDGPKDYDEWREVPARLPDAARKYLEKWRDSFELFHPTKPWLQIASLESGKSAEEGWGSVSKLGFFMASGANTTLFDHEGMDNDGRHIPLAATVLSMLSFQCFSPGGLISQVMWNGVQTSKSSKDGPCVSASMVHALVRRENLMLTIRANLPTYEDVAFAYGDHPIGHPVWETLPKSLNDESAKRNATQSYVGRLVPLTRVIRLNQDGSRMLMGEGLPYPPFTDGFPAEPTSIVIVRRTKDKKPERGLLSYRPGQALWRELAAMVVRRNAEGVGGPLSLRSLGDGDSCDLVVAALARDQATILDTAESVYSVSPKLRSTDGRSVYEAEAREAEGLAKRLGWAIEDYRRTLDGGWEGRLKGAGSKKGEILAKLHGTGLTQFWTAVEKNLGLLMTHVTALGTEQAMPTREAWRTMLWKTACDAYRAVCGQETPRQIKAFTEGWKKLNAKPKDPEMKTPKKGAKR
jgi:CRISPR system Cascade subunit CasA